MQNNKQTMKNTRAQLQQSYRSRNQIKPREKTQDRHMHVYEERKQKRHTNI